MAHSCLVLCSGLFCCFCFLDILPSSLPPSVFFVWCCCCFGFLHLLPSPPPPHTHTNFFSLFLLFLFASYFAVLPPPPPPHFVFFLHVTPFLPYIPPPHWKRGPFVVVGFVSFVFFPLLLFSPPPHPPSVVGFVSFVFFPLLLFSPPTPRLLFVSFVFFPSSSSPPPPPLLLLAFPHPPATPPSPPTSVVVVFVSFVFSHPPPPPPHTQFLLYRFKTFLLVLLRFTICSLFSCCLSFYSLKKELSVKN